MFKIPKRFRLGGFDIKVSRKKQDMRGHDGREWRGYYDPDPKNRHIWIAPDTEVPTETFWHEFMHAGFDESGVRQTPGWSNDIEEILSERFARYLTEFMKGKK